MKFLHCGDLHIGKQVNGFSMIEDQRYILNEIIKIIDDKKPDGVIIAGDVYDKPVASAEAMVLFDEFLFQLADKKIKTFIISGNHDSAERLSCGSRLMSSEGAYISKAYDGNCEPIVVLDEFGEINIYLLPFVKPVHVRSNFEDKDIKTYEEAVKVAIKQMDIDSSKRNILVTHQFVAGSERSDSEEMSVGGTDNIGVEVFDDFDYIALGHIHKPQKIGRETMRYSGSPLKYSFSEANHKKSVTIVDFKEKGTVNIETVELKPKRDLVEIKGKYNDIVEKSFYENLNTDDYFHITLTDEDEVFDVLNKLRVIYKNIMKLDYDNKRTKQSETLNISDDYERKAPIDWVSEFYENRNNQELNEEQENLLKSLIEKIWGNL